MSAIGPSPFTMSLKLCISVLVMALISGAATTYDERKITSPIITPMAEMIDETIKPHKMLNMPLVENFAILFVLLNETRSPRREFLQSYTYTNKLVI